MSECPAAAIVFARVILEIATVTPSFLTVALWPLAAMMLATAISACAMWFWGCGKIEAIPTQENPSELKSTLVFGLLYAIVLLAVALAKERYGSRGLYFVAGLSGLTDVDAITLSTSQMVNLDRISADQGWRLIVIAKMSNLVFKALIVATLGHRVACWNRRMFRYCFDCRNADAVQIVSPIVQHREQSI